MAITDMTIKCYQNKSIFLKMCALIAVAIMILLFMPIRILTCAALTIVLLPYLALHVIVGGVKRHHSVQLLILIWDFK